jgi:hypothetical protein
MRITPVAAGLCLALSQAATAASGQIDSFGASATTVVAGTVVDFALGYGVFTSSWMSGGSNPFEPPPQEGYQSWDINWYTTESETLDHVWLQAGGQSTTDFPTALPGASHTGSWSFSMQFDTPGRYEITASGGWTNWVDFYTSNESASRECWNNDPGGTDELACSWWTYQYSDWSDHYTTEGVFAPRTLVVDVLAVPEPHGLALGLAGLGALGLLKTRRTWRRPG